MYDVTWQQAVTKVHSFNTIAALVYHINYYVSVTLKVLQGGPLDGHDKYSFDLPPIQSQEDWERLLNKTWTDAEAFASYEAGNRLKRDLQCLGAKSSPNSASRPQAEKNEIRRTYFCPCLNRIEQGLFIAPPRVNIAPTWIETTVF